ncbi:uncharacterized protein [Amphiura filiformis]|uniref:uncharacterized protein n=1 Tax=Amphiura filiformis TaxID=82378 RepID=UPI003B21E685
MEDAENEPRSLLSEVMPTPMPKSTLPCNIGDPLLSLTPEKPTRPLGTTKQGCVRVERHLPTGALSNGRINVITNTATELRSNVSTQDNQGVQVHVNCDITRTTARVKENNAKSKGSKKSQKCVRIEEPCRLKEPQCHTTAIVGQHLESLQREEFHGDAAVLKVLEESQTVRTAFAEKVAEGVNRPIDERKYSGLIAIDVPVRETIAQATEEKLVRVKGAQGAKKTSKISEGPVPDILDVFNPDMIVEQPSFDVPGVQSNNIQLQQAPADMAFNLYKHMRCWQST